MSLTYGRSVVFYGYSGFLHHQNWLARYNWNIVESGVKHHQTNTQHTFLYLKDVNLSCMPLSISKRHLVLLIGRYYRNKLLHWVLLIMFVSAIKYMYANVQCSIRLNGNLIDKVNVKQVCALSPLLFNLYINIRFA